jgi:hypothetical protein
LPPATVFAALITRTSTLPRWRVSIPAASAAGEIRTMAATDTPGKSKMTAKILDGNALAQKLRADFKTRAEALLPAAAPAPAWR